VESGRRAAKAVDNRIVVLDQYQPGWIKFLSGMDNLLFTVRAPQLVDVFIIILSVAVLLCVLA
jgi:hypothetical protein